MANMRRKYMYFLRRVLPGFVGEEERVFVSAMFFVALSPEKFRLRLEGMATEDFVSMMKVLDKELGHTVAFRENFNDKVNIIDVYAFFFNEAKKHDDWFHTYIKYVALWKNSGAISTFPLLESIVAIDTNILFSCDMNTLLSLIGVAHPDFCDSLEDNVLRPGDYFVVNTYGRNPQCDDKRFIATSLAPTSESENHSVLHIIYPFADFEPRGTHYFLKRQEKPLCSIFRASKMFKYRDRLRMLGDYEVQNMFRDTFSSNGVDPSIIDDNISKSRVLLTGEQIVA